MRERAAVRVWGEVVPTEAVRCVGIVPGKQTSVRENMGNIKVT